jgi:LCP family protein required for cell wall assembly
MAVIFQRNSPRRRWLWALTPAAVIILLGAAGFWYLQHLGLRPWDNIIRGPFNPPFGGLKQVNVLILGVDGEDPEPRRSDTIMITRFDLSQKRLGIVSIPRDFRVAIPGHGEQKINSAFSLGGVELTSRTIADLIGVRPDYYIAIDSAGLERLVDALGGVEINVDKRMHYHDRAQRLNIDLQPGLQRLNGNQAVGYVRFRHDRTGDLARIGRQQNFIRAVMHEAVQPRNLPRLPRLLSLFAKSVETNLTVSDLKAMSGLLKEIGPERVKAVTAPGSTLDLHGVSYLEPDSERMLRMVNEVLFNVSPRIAIVNATEIPGVEAGLVKRLNDAGFDVSEVRFASHAVSASEVVDQQSHPEEAAEIQRWLNCGTVVRRDGEEVPGADITILLGTDYIGREAD